MTAEEALISAIINAYHTTRIRHTPVADHILSKKSVRTAMEAYAAEKVADVLAACPAATSMHGCPSYRPEPRHD